MIKKKRVHLSTSKVVLPDFIAKYGTNMVPFQTFIQEIRDALTEWEKQNYDYDTVVEVNTLHDAEFENYGFRLNLHLFRDETDKECEKRMAVLAKTKNRNRKDREEQELYERKEYERLKKKFCPEDK